MSALDGLALSFAKMPHGSCSSSPVGHQSFTEIAGPIDGVSGFVVSFPPSNLGSELAQDRASHIVAHRIQALVRVEASLVEPTQPLSDLLDVSSLEQEILQR